MGANALKLGSGCKDCMGGYKDANRENVCVSLCVCPFMCA